MNYFFYQDVQLRKLWGRQKARAMSATGLDDKKEELDGKRK